MLANGISLGELIPWMSDLIICVTGGNSSLLEIQVKSSQVYWEYSGPMTTEAVIYYYWQSGKDHNLHRQRSL